MQPWKTIHRKTAFACGKYLTVELHDIQLPDGQVIDNWPWIVTPDFINILVQMEDGRFPVFRQTKYAVEGVTLAPVGGYLEPGEDALATAQRELCEEMGMEAAHWQPLGSYAVDGNRGNGRGHLFLARQARVVCEINADDLEEHELIYLSRGELEAALDAGRFGVAPWAAVVALGLRQLDRAERG